MKVCIQIKTQSYPIDDDNIEGGGCARTFFMSGFQGIKSLTINGSDHASFR